MDGEPEVIRGQMEETRSNLTEKLAALENHVVGTVQSATTAVSDTVENVKEAVQSTVDSVKDTVGETVASVKESMDIRQHVDRHPWASLGVSMAVGFLGGKLLGRRPPTALPPPTPFAYQPQQPVLANAAPVAAARGFFDSFGPEIESVKSLAVGVALGLVRDVVRQSASEQLAPHLTTLIDDVTRKLGGKPIDGSILPDDAHRPVNRIKDYA